MLLFLQEQIKDIVTSSSRQQVQCAVAVWPQCSLCGCADPDLLCNTASGNGNQGYRDQRLRPFRLQKASQTRTSLSTLRPTRWRERSSLVHAGSTFASPSRTNNSPCCPLFHTRPGPCHTYLQINISTP